MCKIGADLQSDTNLNTSNMGILLKIVDFEGGIILYLGRSY